MSTERLQKIRARCVSLLETASKRTPGEWGAVEMHNSTNTRIFAGGYYLGSIGNSDADNVESESNANFISGCAGPAEAGWRATIAAIDGLLYMTPGMSQQATINEILTAWEGVEL